MGVGVAVVVEGDKYRFLGLLCVTVPAVTGIDVEDVVGVEDDKDIPPGITVSGFTCKDCSIALPGSAKVSLDDELEDPMSPMGCVSTRYLRLARASTFLLCGAPF